MTYVGESLNATSDVCLADGTCLSSVGIGTTSPSKKLEINGTSGAINFDPAATTPEISTTNSQNLSITSSGGSVIIQLG